jgi:ketosteroid isomerase-like protein
MAHANPFTEHAAGDADDHELVRRIQGGNRQALEALIERHQPWIYNILVRMLYLPQEAEDATQEVLIYAPDLTYFDPVQEKRIDGLEAMKALYAPYAGTIKVDRFDMIDPAVQHHGDVAVLTFNLLSHRMQPDGTEAVIARWNSTEVYRRTEGTWAIIHSHWSYLQPELKTAVSESIS